MRLPFEDSCSTWGLGVAFSPGKTAWVSQIRITMEMMFLKREVFSRLSRAFTEIFLEKERLFSLRKLRMRVEVGRCMCLTTWSVMSIPVVANEASSGYCVIFEIKVNVSKRN